MQLEFSLLNEGSNLNAFDCGEEELNTFLKDLALLFQRRCFGVTVTFFEKEDPIKRVLGFYTLCPASIQKDLLPEKFLTGPKPNPIPAFRICRLAVDKGFQGQGIGQMIFIHALKKCLDQANQIGGSVVVIDAKHDKAKSFYERFGFISLPNHPLILVQTIKYVKLHFN
jgi:GNAT superfamily N-acetyltransferase